MSKYLNYQNKSSSILLKAGKDFISKCYPMSNSCILIILLSYCLSLPLQQPKKGKLSGFWSEQLTFSMLCMYLQ